MGDSPNLDWLISVDDHVLEPTDVWQKRVPAKYRDIAPRMVTDKELGEVWLYEDKRSITAGLAAVAGKRREEFGWEPVTYSEMRAGCYDSIARLEDMDRAGVLAALCFPSYPRFCGQIFTEAKDHDLALLCVKAYNDWMIDEWCGSAPGRYIPLIIMPLWDPELAAAEVRRCAERGCHAITFPENPEPLGLPTVNDLNRYWDPLWAACQETETVVCMHIGSSSVSMRYANDSYTVMTLAWGNGTRSSGTMLTWLFSPVFDRFPGIKIALSEGGIGWMPHFLEHAEQVVDKQRHWAARGDFAGGLLEAQHAGFSAATMMDPSKALNLENFDVRQRFRDHIYGCFIEDAVGLAHVRELGVDNIMIETDYPHSDSTWPNCITVAQKQLAATDLTDEEKYKILRGNAERLYKFTPAPFPS